ncbi:hypothetical protein [uncultured Nonlabens sp.]|uniref:hypothetical protein n=1 Tax=uncultured Nonlabens sp. TaxID=859306 RepID=UPI002604A0C6|nr:hypothetical protein [uncultured Nonlabens sp.]
MHLKNKTNQDLIEYLNDLIEDSYVFISPEKLLTEKIVNELINRIILNVESNSITQFELLECLYNWSWFPCEENIYSNLIESINNRKITHPSNLIVSLKIFGNSGLCRYVSFFKEFTYHENIEVKKTALNILHSLESNCQDSVSENS